MSLSSRAMSISRQAKYRIAEFGERSRELAERESEERQKNG
jgi:hypothetical protein